MAFRWLLVWLPLSSSQPPGPRCLEPSRPACPSVDSPEVLLRNSSGLCPERVWPQNYWGSYWGNYTQLDQPSPCIVPVEVRVGLTMSLSGDLFDPASAAKLLQMLVNMSSSYRDPGKYCISFCVLDDGSSPRRVAQLYRSFAGEAGEVHEVDVLFGPATFGFRSIAAQVAQESQKPLLLWSTTATLGHKVASPAQQLTSTEAIGEVRNLRQIWRDGGLSQDVPSECGDFCEVLQGSPFSVGETCAQLTPPAGRELRPLAKYLSCEGPCDIVTDLDFCTRNVSTLSVQGTWEPAGALRHGGWQAGCLEGVALAHNQTSMRLTLHFDESPVKVRVFMNGTLAPYGELRLEGSSIYIPGELLHILTDGSELLFEYSGDTDADWSICLVQTCSSFVCNASYMPDPLAVCQGFACDPQADHEVCCIKEPPDQTTFLGQDYLSTTMDMSIPPSYWLHDILRRLYEDDRSELFACVAQNDPRGLFRDLCKAYVASAISDGFKTLPTGPLTLNADNAVADMIAKLQQFKPLPQIVLICADLPVFSSFLYGMITNQGAFNWVVSAFPFDHALRYVVPAYTLFYNVLETAPWPSWQYLTEYAEQPSACATPSTLHQPLRQEKDELLQIGLSVQELHLASAGQILESVVCSNYNNFSFIYLSMVQEMSPGRDGPASFYFPEDDGRLGFLYFLRDGLSQLGQGGGGTRGFATSLGQVYFGNRGNRINLARHDVSSWRHEILPPLQDLSETVSASDSWLYNQARFSISQPSSISEPVLHAQLWPMGRKVLGTFPCPVGCRATNVYTCVACRPGFYRPDGETGCVPCTQLATDVFQDSWAGAMCFKCPTGAFCDASRPAEAPIALPGYFRVENQTYTAKFGKWSVESACSFNQGLADAHATEMSSWAEAKKNHRWLFQRCLPASSCLGNNQCFELNRGVGCEMCVEGYTKYESYFLYTSCRKCPPFWWLILECCVPGVFQFFAVLVLVRAGHSTAVNRLSLAAPLLVALLQGLQMHANLSKIMNNVGAAREDLGRLIYAVTWTELLIAPCLAPWMLCHLPVHGEADVGLYVFLVVASSFVPSAAYFLLQLFNTCRGRASRHTLVRTLIASNYVALPTALRATLEVTRCSRDANLQRTLDIDRSILCSDDPFEGTNLLQSLVVIICMVVLLLETLLHWRTLKEAKYLHVQESLGLLHLKLIPNMWYWRVMDNFRVYSFIFWLSTGDLTVNFACQVLAVLELTYSSLLVGFAPYTRMSADAVLLLKEAISGILGILSLMLFLTTWVEPSTVSEEALRAQPFLVVIDELLDRFAVGDVLVGLSGLLIVLKGCLKLIDNRWALPYNMKFQTGSPSRCGSVFLGLLRRFPGSHSMLVHRYGETVMLDTRNIPPKQRSKLLIGVASGLRFLFAQSGEFKINDVRRQISDSATMVSTARKARFMIKSAVARGEAFERLWSGRHQREGVGSADEKVLYKKLVAAMQQVTEAELSAAVEDMCDGDMMQEHFLPTFYERLRRRKKVELVDEEDDEENFNVITRPTQDSAHRFFRKKKEDDWEEPEMPFEKLEVEEPKQKLEEMERKLWTLMHEEGVSGLETEAQELSEYGQKLLYQFRQVQALLSVMQQMSEFEPIGETDALRRGSTMNFSQQLIVDMNAIKDGGGSPVREMVTELRSLPRPEAKDELQMPQDLNVARQHSWSESSSSVLSGINSNPLGSASAGGWRRSFESEAALMADATQQDSPRRGSADSIPGRTPFLPARLALDWSAKQQPAASLVPALDRQLSPEEDACS